MNTLDFANFYSDKNWPVFPCWPKTKNPMTKNGFKDATTDKAQIAEWWGRSPDANIGIATGHTSKLLVLDIDAKSNGDATLMKLQDENGQLPRTVISHTGGGGRHILFHLNPDTKISNSAGKLGPGLDTRGVGGYIVAPPSLHESGKFYAWDKFRAPSKTEIALPPEWMIAMLRTPTPVLDIPVDEGENVYAPGTRHSAFLSLAGTMRRRGMSEKAIYDALIAENERCVPPHEEKDIRKIATSIFEYPAEAALPMIRQGRMQCEWSFAKSIYEHPINLSDFEWLKPEFFGDKALAAFWAVTLEIKDTIAAATRSSTLTDLQAWKDYNPDRVDAYAQEIARYGYLDGITKTAANLQRLAESGDVAKVSSVIQSLSDVRQISTVAPQDASEGLAELTATLETGAFIKTGVGNVDETVGGLEMKAMSILAARPGMGKTSLAWQIARNVALTETVLFFSLEVAAVKLWRKAALGIAEVSPSDIFNKKVSPGKLRHIYDTIIPNLRDTYQGKLFLYDQITDTDIMWRMASQLQPSLIIIDHMRYMDDDADNEVQRLGLISKRGKQFAKNGVGCHVMFLHQLSRAVTTRDDKAPQLTDLRESGHVEENADQVFMIHRPGYYDVDAAKRRYSETQLLIRKNRDDISGIPFGLFYDLSQQWFYRQDEIPKNHREVCLDGKLQRTVSLDDKEPIYPH